MPKFDWTKSARYNQDVKVGFHAAARRQLRSLAKELGFERGTYDIRSNQGGVAISGEVILHHDEIYVHVSQPATGNNDMGVMIRTCEGRTDYSGGPNHFAPLDKLDDIAGLSRQVRGIMPSTRTDELLASQSDEERDQYYQRLSL